jgi:S-formylglutathione hydrolase FrmB
MKPRAREDWLLSGTVERAAVDSRALAAGRCGDPTRREVCVVLPPRRRKASRSRWPVLFYLASFTSRGADQLETHPWRRKLAARYDRAVREGAAPEAILVFPDAFTHLGGSQYVNSSYLGRYADYVASELTAWVDAHFPTRRGARGVLGKSSGGFGALHLAMTQPGAFQAVASICGDCAFELCYLPELYAGLRALAPFGGRPERFLCAFGAGHRLDGPTHAALTMLALSAAYSPVARARKGAAGFELPLDPRTAQLDSRVWARWLEFDPLRAAERHARELAGLKRLVLECGSADEYNLAFAQRRLAQRLHRLGVPHRAREHPGGHGGLDDRVLACAIELARALG